jgi:hypothetical protein
VAPSALSGRAIPDGTRGLHVTGEGGPRATRDRILHANSCQRSGVGLAFSGELHKSVDDMA